MESSSDSIASEKSTRNRQPPLAPGLRVAAAAADIKRKEPQDASSSDGDDAPLQQSQKQQQQQQQQEQQQQRKMQAASRPVTAGVMGAQQLGVRKQALKKAAAKAARKPENPETDAPGAADPEHETPSLPTLTALFRSPETETPHAELPTEKYADFVGETPLIELTQMVKSFRNPNVRVFAKCEFFNPSLSIKDRIVYNIFDEAEAEGRLRQGMTVVAASSGNTGAACAMVCAMRGYKCIITTSPKCSKEKMDAIKAYGAKLLVSPPGVPEGHPDHYMEMAKRMALEDPERFFDVDQYETQSNPMGHYKTLGPEILEQTNGAITHFVAAGSTGGTISGVGRFLKEEVPGVKVVLADPVGSVFTNYFRTGELGTAGKFCVEGVGKGSIPGAMDFKLIDDVIPVEDLRAFETCHELARTQGICAGGSAGLNVFAALELASQCEDDAVIVTVMPDCGPKNLSKVYNPEWLKENGFLCRCCLAPEKSKAQPTRTPEQRLREADEGLLPENSSSFPTAQQARRQVEVDACLYRDLVGGTPLVDLSHMVRRPGHAETRVLAKCEFFNPGYSIKDRIVQNIMDKAEADGRLRPGMTVVAASSGNTGASTAMMCAMRGYDCIVTTCTKCSKEKMDAIKAYGAELLVSPPGVPEGHPDHYMEMARLLALQDPERYFDMDQYESQSNPEGHYLTLAPEIWDQSLGKVTHFVAGGSTGGTISGVARLLKERNPDVKAILADPVGSIFTNYFRTGEIGTAGKFCVEGVGKGSIPGAMDFKLIDDVIPVSDQEAFDTCFRLCREDGICAGGSSGLNLFAALQLAETLTEPAVIVTTFADLGCKYLSKLYNDDWLRENGFTPPSEPDF